ncbi:hypothetical protein FXV77_14110 [Sphingobacterium phlebotomi]|uniref:Yip1 domain-containing protein n=1 Tax=Sphingobacterium phlebotomi TaxID=2605433 RepID=A0A5D4H390_9SPHI|nr:YIP1 family protein [Sphingobacterium phlebotomi]TYR35077.1 hypothetical protein FXV77_14110 [Sphingobacterium phlebotomi]
MKYNMERLFLNPFEDYSEKNLLWIGIVGFVLGIIISYFGKIVFDGIIQIHMGVTNITAIILGNLSNMGILTLGLFMLAKVLYKKTRFVDILNNVLIARIPMLLAGLLVVWMTKLVPMGKTAEINLAMSLDQSDMMWIALLAIFLLFMIIYFFYLLVIGVRHSINSKKFGHGFLIVIAVFVLDSMALLVYRGFFI